MENKKTKIVSIISIIALVLTVITATYAYFQAQTGEGSQTDVKINANTVDTLSFETGSSLTFTADQNTFANGKASLSDTTFAKAILTANNKTNSATNNYNLYLNISDNNFIYTQDTNTPELLLQITDASNNSITSIDGLTYKTVTDNKNTSISGFDITNKTGLINLFTNREITTTSTKTEEWTIKITFVNYNKDQSANAGKSFAGQILISKDTFDNYTPNTINTLSATKSGTNLTVNLNVEQGSNEIDKYYYAIEETNGIALIDNTSKVQRLSNRLAVSNLTYVESNSSSHTFTNLSSTKDYKVSAYVIDKKKIKSNTYEYNVSSGSYVYPTISKVETNTTSNSITATVTATKGTNNISKYYYSIDNGSTFIESTSNSYTFSNLNGGSYRIMVKVIDTNSIYSNIYVVNEKIISSSSNLIRFTYAGTEYSAEKGMTFAQWAESEYNTFGYFIEEDTLIEENKSYENFHNAVIENAAGNECYSTGISCVIYQKEGTFIESLSETNLKTIYKKDNYNDIGKTYGYLERPHTYDFGELYKVANNLNASQQTFLQNFIDSNLEPISGLTFFVNIDTTVLSPDSNGYYTIPIRAEILKELNIDCVKLLMFDGTTGNFSNPQIEDYDNSYGIITLKVKENFAIAFFQYEEL